MVSFEVRHSTFDTSPAGEHPLMAARSRRGHMSKIE